MAMLIMALEGDGCEDRGQGAQGDQLPPDREGNEGVELWQKGAEDGMELSTYQGCDI